MKTPHPRVPRPCPRVGTKAAYDGYIHNGLMKQLNRIELGKNLEEAHMRNRQMIARWVLEKGRSSQVIEKRMMSGKTYFIINDDSRLRVLFGELLREVQRIKSQGDGKAGAKLMEDYGVRIDADLHREVPDRYSKLDLASYYGFIQPRLTPVMDGDGEVMDIEISYLEDFDEQQLRYAREYSYLPTYNLSPSDRPRGQSPTHNGNPHHSIRSLA